MNSAAEIIADLRMLYNEVSQGLSAANIVFHVIAGISGGTGSGTFLDVCYLIKDAFPGTSILGYFFMPEVNADVIGDDNYMLFIKQNGYAALQELDYCMSFCTPAGGSNNGCFDVIYPNLGHKVKWDSRPILCCHLIGTDDMTGLGFGVDRYKYAMHTVAEFILDFLVQTHNAIPSIPAEYSNSIVRCANEENDRGDDGGTSPYYSVMGYSEAVIPFKSINTYIVAYLFDKFSCLLPDNTVPDENAGLEVMRESLGIKKTYKNFFLDQFYRVIRRYLQGGVATDFTPYEGSLKDINWFNCVTDEETLRQYQTDIIIPSELYTHLQSQYMENVERIKCI